MVNYIHIREKFAERCFMDKNTLIIKILKLIVIALVIICSVGLLILGLLSIPDKNTEDPNGPAYPTGSDQTEIDLNNVILPQSADAGDEYINKIYFVGDSTTLHFYKGGIDRSHIFVPNGGTLMLSSDILDIKVTDKNLSIPQAVKNANAEILIITLGVNGADSFSELSYKTYYKKLINAIKEASPNTKIILQSVFPITKDFSEKDKGISNAGIDRLNEWAKEIAVDCSLRYLDTQSILKNSDGAQIIEFSEGDGVHMNASAYTRIIEYIKTHAIN